MNEKDYDFLTRAIAKTIIDATDELLNRMGGKTSKNCATVFSYTAAILEAYFCKTLGCYYCGVSEVVSREEYVKKIVDMFASNLNTAIDEANETLNKAD
jgi:coproporphyrinogen III oxidase-like Fe-S oxidoreductase